MLRMDFNLHFSVSSDEGRAMDLSRRWIIKSLAASAVMLPHMRPAFANAAQSSIVLDNGLRVTAIRSESPFVNATLILRSARIFNDAGLGHIVEHTSFVGAAGDWSAKAVKDAQQDVIQESNARTQPGMIRWDACFLPDYLGSAIELLSLTSLDQKFDVETVASEQRIVLQELYLDKFSPNRRSERDLSVALFGRDHPNAFDMTDREIAKASTPEAKLAAELREYAAGIRLPGNMELFVAGQIDPEQLQALARRHFGRYAQASGPLLEFPAVGPTRAHKSLKGRSSELTAPLSHLRMAWNTGVRITDKDAAAVVALADYINRKLFNRLREEYGDSYSPDASFDPDGCSGIFSVSVDTSTDPEKVERRVIDTFDSLKHEIDIKELSRFRSRMELKRRRDALSNEALIDRMVDRVTEGASQLDLHPESVTVDELKTAAQTYLPGFREGYVRLVLSGQKGAPQVAATSSRRGHAAPIATSGRH